MSTRACPVCAKPAAAEHRPFCSRRCADVDLQRWFAGSYIVPGGARGAPSREGEGSEAED